MLLDIHLEWCDDKGERLRQLADIGKPFVVSLVPVLMLPEHKVFEEGVYRPDYFYNKDIMEFLKKIPKEYPHITFGQQGLTHYCPDCYKTWDKNKNEFKHDPWHENKCFYNKEESVLDQFKLMKEGKTTIENVVGVSPVVYSPPNHQYDENTGFSAVELKYDYLTTKGIINLSPYKEDGLKILPERKLGQSGEVFYAHYDKMKDNLGKYTNMIKSSKPLSEIKFKEKSIYSSLNETLILASKLARDNGWR